MKRFLFFLSAFISLSASPSLAISSSKDELELLTALGPLEMWQTSDWISADTSLASFEQKEQADFESILSNSPSFFIHVDYSYAPIPNMLFWQHDRYFVNVCGETDVGFSVLYRDPYNNPAADGYPKLTFWPQGSSDHTTLPLIYVDARDGGAYYTKNLALPVGVYYYCYSARNDMSPDEYVTEVSSFVVTMRPGVCNNTNGVSGSAVVSNAKVVLEWQPSDGDRRDLTYKLFLGSDPGAMSLIYEGSLPRFEVFSLDYGKQYYWQIEACNGYGVSSKTPVYQFNTIAHTSKSYNYPNPFNPARNQKTNILFTMNGPGAAELRIYTEMGDLCWQRSFDGLVPGANEITYDGKDDHGRTLYNGTYVCFIKKKYAGREEKESCRLMVIK